MKKLLALSALSLLLVLTACGGEEKQKENSRVCTMEVDGVESEILLKHDDDEIVQTIEVSASQDTGVEVTDELLEETRKQMDELMGEIDGFEMKFSRGEKDTELKVTMIMDLNKITDAAAAASGEDFSQYKDMKVDDIIKEMKASAEAEGKKLECK